MRAAVSKDPDCPLIRYSCVARRWPIDKLIRTRGVTIFLVLGVISLDVYTILALFAPTLEFALLIRGDVVSLLGLLFAALVVSVCGILFRQRHFRWLLLAVVGFMTISMTIESAYYTIDHFYELDHVRMEGETLSLTIATYWLRWVVIAMANWYVLFGPIGRSYFQRGNRRTARR